MNLNQCIDFWEDYLKSWDRNPAGLATLEKSRGHYFANSKRLSPFIEYLPEPYYGDPDNISFVVIDLNPALSHFNDCKKLYKAPGAFLYDFFNSHSSSYIAFNKKFSPFNANSISSIGTRMEVPGAKWWQEKRIKWINKFVDRFLANKPLVKSHSNPFVFELCPWHSDEWDDAIVTGMNSFLLNTVFNPAAEAVKKSILPFGFCFGKGIGDLLISLGFKVIYQRDNSNPLSKWPLNNKGNLVNRTYRLLESQNKDVYFLNLYADGTFYAPSKEFIENVDPIIIKDILAII